MAREITQVSCRCRRQRECGKCEARAFCFFADSLRFLFTPAFCDATSSIS